MILVQAFIELPDSFESEGAALEYLASTYGQSDVNAVCEASRSSEGLLVDAPELVDLCYGPEFPTFAVRVFDEEIREVEEQFELGPVLNEVTGEYEALFETVVREEIVRTDRVLAVSFFPEVEDA